MRRLVLEWSLEDASSVMRQQLGQAKAEGRNPKIIAEMQQRGLEMLEMLKKIKSLEMVHILKLDRDGFAVIFRLELKDPSLDIEELMANAMKGTVDGTLQLLEHEEEKTYTYLVKGKPIQPDDGVDSKKLSVYPLMPSFGLRDGKVRITQLGDNRQVKEVLESVQKLGIHYRIVSLMDAKFSPTSPISHLTSKQRDAIILAFKLGYFDTPRKVSSEQLAKKLGLANSTLAVHLRRAEHRLLSEMLNV
jgi:hypothetical protein